MRLGNFSEASIKSKVTQAIGLCRQGQSKVARELYHVKVVYFVNVHWP